MPGPRGRTSTQSSRRTDARARSAPGQSQRDSPLAERERRADGEGQRQVVRVDRPCHREQRDSQVVVDAPVLPLDEAVERGVTDDAIESGIELAIARVLGGWFGRTSDSAYDSRFVAVRTCRTSDSIGVVFKQETAPVAAGTALVALQRRVPWQRSPVSDKALTPR